MNVRAYLASDNTLCPSKDAASHVDFDTDSKDEEAIRQFCATVFGGKIMCIGHVDSKKALKAHLEDQIYRRIKWSGEGIYLFWIPHTIIYRSDRLLERELKFAFGLEEHLERNLEGDFDRILMEL